MSRFERVKRIVFGTPDSIASTVYGTIVVMAAVTAGSGADVDAGRLAVIVSSSVLVLWLAHVYSDALAETIQRGQRLDTAELFSVTRREIAIPLAAVGPVGALVLGALGILEDSTAGWCALLIGLAVLGVQGFRYAGAESLRGVAVLISVAFNLALGLVIVGLKAGVAH
jgi:hypothetical protein